MGPADLCRRYVHAGHPVGLPADLCGSGEAKISLFLALLRKIILLLPLILLLPHLFADKVFGVFLAEPAADILAATVTGLMFLWRFPRILRRREQELRHADG